MNEAHVYRKFIQGTIKEFFFFFSLQKSMRQVLNEVLN